MEQAEEVYNLEVYTRACEALKDAETVEEFEEVAEVFKDLDEYKDSAALAEKCIAEADALRKDAILFMAKQDMSFKNKEGYTSAIRQLEAIPGWKDADELKEICLQKIEELKNETKRTFKLVFIIIAVICAVIAMANLILNVMIPNIKYNQAVKLMESARYEEAISAFEAMDGYKDSKKNISECKYNSAIALMESGKYAEAISAFETMKSYRDSMGKIYKCRDAIRDARLEEEYNHAISMINDGHIADGYEALLVMNGYKESLQKAEAVYKEYLVEKLKGTNVSKTIYFGAYEQDNISDNGQEKIEWIILEKQDGKALLISKYGLDNQQFNTILTDVTWEKSTLRQWLNSEFLNTAFTEEEKEMIPTVGVSADKNPEYSTNPSNATEDKVFLLSIEEANRFFGSNSARMCKPTEFAIKKGAWKGQEGYGWAWLRSPGYRSRMVADVTEAGHVRTYGNLVDNATATVRPALWIALNE